MSLPLLEVTPSSQNQRVEGYEVPDEDAPRRYRLRDAVSDTAVTDLIWAAYRQIFSEHLVLESYRQRFLESQLRNRAIDVREFVRGLGKSEVYRQLVGETNSNYRLVDITFKRFLGRATYSQDEQISQSIVIATKGLNGFIDQLVDGDEYRENFGNDIVPYQRRRFKDRPFNLVNPRYNGDWRDRQGLRSIEGRYLYQRPTGAVTREVVRRAIPAAFLSMAQSISPAEANYQRTRDRALSQVSSMKLPDMSHNDAAQRTVKPVEVALPYRYIPANSKT